MQHIIRGNFAGEVSSHCFLIIIIIIIFISCFEFLGFFLSFFKFQNDNTGGGSRYSYFTLEKWMKHFFNYYHYYYYYHFLDVFIYIIKKATASKSPFDMLHHNWDSVNLGVFQPCSGKIKWASRSALSEELKDSIRVLVGQVVLE